MSEQILLYWQSYVLVALGIAAPLLAVIAAAVATKYKFVTIARMGAASFSMALITQVLIVFDLHGNVSENDWAGLIDTSIHWLWVSAILTAIVVVGNAIALIRATHTHRAQ